MRNLILIALLWSISIFAAQNTGKFDNITVNTPSKTTVDFKKNVDIQTTGGLYLPSGSTAQRPSPTKDGMVRFNSTLNQVEKYSGGVWGAMGGGGISNWATAKAYVIDDVVIQSQKIYQALTAHTSGTFATDLANGDWQEISATGTVNLASGVTGILPIANGGTGNTSGTATINANSTGDVTSIGNVTTYNGTVPLNKGGTGQTTKAAAFDALSPMTTGGDLIYGGASGTGTRLANGAAGSYLQSNGTTLAPSWVTPSAGNLTGVVTSVGLATSFGTFTSAQLATGASDETGTGALVFGTTPTFTTNLTAPLLIGGTGTGSTLSFKSTSGVGATDALIFQVGNNGATEAMRVMTNGRIGIGTATPDANAIVDITSTTKAFMKPRMTETQMRAIPSPTAGMEVFNTSYGVSAEYNGSAWDYKFSKITGDDSYSLTSSSGTLTNLNKTGWVTSCSNATTSVCTFAAGLFTATPNCTVTTDNAQTNVQGAQITSVSTSSVSIAQAALASGTPVNGKFYLSCQKTGVDYAAASSSAILQAGANFGPTNVGTVTIGATTTAPTKGTASLDRVIATRDGNRLLANFQYAQASGGSAGSGDYLFSLPVVNGTQLQFDSTAVTFYTGANFSSTVTIAGSLVGKGQHGSATENSTCKAYAYNATQFRVMCYQGSAIGSTTTSYPVGSGGACVMSGACGMDWQIDAPISGWSNSPLIIGSFEGIEKCASALECTDTMSAQVALGGGVSNETIDFVNGNCTNATPSVCTFTSGVFTVAPNCWVVSAQSNVNAYVSATTSTTFTIDSFGSSNLTHAQFATVIACQKAGIDSRPKTAKAAVGPAIFQGNAQASTSGTSLDFTVPSGAKRVTVMFNGVSTSGSSIIQVQLATGGSVVSTSYISGAGSRTGEVVSTTGLTWIVPQAANAFSGAMTLNLANGSTNLWTSSGVSARDSDGFMSANGGYKTLSGVLDRVRVTTVNGTDTFNAGVVNVSWEF